MSSAIPLRDAVELFCGRPELAPSTVVNYRSTLDRFRAFVGDVHVDQVDEEKLRGYIDYRRRQGKTHSTIHADVRRVRALMRWHGRSFPPPRRLGLRTPQGRLDFFSLEEVRKLVAWADERSPCERALIYGYLFTGGRATEVLGLERLDVDLESRWITFRLGLKGGSTRRVPICDSSIKAWRGVLEDHARGPLFAGLTYQRMWRLWKLACVESEVRPLTLHHARHTCASLWVMSGIDLVTVKNWLGHSSIQQTMLYAKISPSHGHEAMAKFEGWIQNRIA